MRVFCLYTLTAFAEIVGCYSCMRRSHSDAVRGGWLLVPWRSPPLRGC